MHLRFPSVLLFSLLLALSCAHQTTPTGGPDDRTGPTVQSTEPAQGSVKVDPRIRCVITFSEWISKTTSGKSVSILPSLDGGAKIRVSGKRLEITPNKAFDDSTTYHIIITRALQDLHTNPLASSYTLVFSTGPSLDSGRIMGCVADPSKRIVQLTAALFRAKGAERDSVVFGEPDYLTQTDSAAFFSIENVRPGAYLLIAFNDKNGNNRLDPVSEDAYAAVTPLLSVSPQADTQRLFPVASDTAASRLESVRPVSPEIVIGKLTRRFDTNRGCFAPQWTIECISDSCASPAVSGCRWLAGRTRCALLLSGALTGAPYRVIFNYRRKKDTSFIAVRDTLRFNGLTIKDTVPPALVSKPPSGAVPLMPEINLQFSEPVMLKGPLFLTDSLRDTVRLAADTGFADTVVLTPHRNLHPTDRYRLVLLKNNGCDLAGNPLKARDSTDTVAVLRYSVIAADSLAISLKGCSPCLAPEPKRKWRFIPFSGRKESICPDSGGCFGFDSIPYGKGNIGYFIDENNNNMQDPGSLVPWLAPEPSMVFPDTVEARARWEIEGVTVSKACTWCEKHRTAAVVPVENRIEDNKKDRP